MAVSSYADKAEEGLDACLVAAFLARRGLQKNFCGTAVAPALRHVTILADMG